jgi:hypothetical protein
MDKTQYYIPCIKVQDLIKANYNLTLDGNREQKILISTLISPLIDQIQRITGKKDVFLKEIVQVEAKHDKKKEKNYRFLLNNGFIYNNIKYLRFGKSASQAKQGITVFVADYVYDELMKVSMLDIEMENKPVVISKYEAQRCLIFSTCVLLNIKMPNIVIVDEYTKIIPNQKIRYAEEVEGISKDGSKYKYRQIKDGTKDIKISPFDGCGIHCEDLGWAAKEEIGLDYRPIGLQVRLPFMKRIFC